jgi:ElaB/YqjD/DUF883 family membrane-anchored ribosome-binding protein
VAGQAFSLQLNVTGGTAPYTWSVSNGSLPSGLALDPTTGIISGTPTTPGTYTFTVGMQDANGGAATKDFTLVVAPFVGGFSYTRTPSGAAISSPVTVHIHGVFGADFCDSGAFQYSVQINSQSGHENFPINTGGYGHSPGSVVDDNFIFNLPAGNYSLVQLVCIRVGTTARVNLENGLFSVVVNHAPVLSPISDKTVDAGQQVQFTVSATDPDQGDVVTLSAANVPTGASFDPQSGIFNWTPVTANVGIYPVTFTATDNGSPVLSANQTVNITVNPPADSVAPVAVPTQSPAANGAGWNNTDVAVNWNWTDEAGGSGVDANNCTQSSTSAGEGSITLTATCKDLAGNVGSSTYMVNIDKTVPTISAAATTQPNANNWFNTNVTTHFTCADAGSGIPAGTCPQDQVLTTEGPAVSSTAQTVTDVAGNTSAASNVVTVGIDKTAPTLTNTVTPAPNAAGWNNSNVTVHFACTDVLSGVAATSPDTTFTGEGTNLAAQGTCTDQAGNATTNTVSNIKIDTTAPITTITAPSGWSNTGVTLALNANDALSGVNMTNYTVDGGATQTGTSIALSTDGIHTVEYWSTDVAGNVETHHTAQVKIDKTAPTITHTQSPVANTNGWNNSSVTVTFVCASSISGIASCTSPQTKTTQGQNQVVTGTAVNNAGTSATDPATVSIDTTAPTITAAVDRAANSHGWYNNNVLVSYTCADALSGIATCTAAQTLTEGANQTAQGAATDAAGNTATASVTGINVDKTAPTIAITSPTSTSYVNTVQFPITWTASDALSGLATQSATFDGAAVTNGQSINLLNQTIGTHTVTVTATDNAGNVKTTTASFFIVVTATSLSNTIDSLLASGGITNAGQANSLKAKLPSQLNAFINELNAQRGKKITEQAYQTLLAAAQYLQAHP